MSELPVPVRDFILELTEDTRSPAFMLVGNDNRAAEWGGDWAAHDVADLNEETDVTERVPFLQGLLPLDTNNLHLPYVQTRAGMYADIYLFRRKEGTWVLLLDATVDANRRQRLQQKSSDLRLQVVELEREEEALYKAQSILEERVRERTDDLAQTNLQLRNELKERKRVERELRESESCFRRLFESNMIGIMFRDAQGNITEANDAFLEMLGYTHEDLRRGQMRWDKVTRPESLSLDENAFSEMQATGACSPFSREFIRKDGTPVTLIFGAGVMEGGRNKVVCFTAKPSRRE